MSELMDFDKLQDKVNDMQDRRQQLDLDEDQMRETIDDVKEQLKDLKAQRSNLNRQESELQKQLATSSRQIEAFKKQRRSSDVAYKEIMEQYEQAKSKRNDKLVMWWMREYGNFDDMNLSELKDWITNAVIHQRQSNDSDTTDDTDSDDERYQEHLKTLHASRQAEKQKALDHQRQVEADEADKTTERENVAKSNEQHGQKLSDKQRTYGNQQANNPIDTKAEAEDAEEAESPFGHEDINKELDDYAKQSAEPDSHKKLSREDVAKQFQDEFNL